MPPSTHEERPDATSQNSVQMSFAPDDYQRLSNLAPEGKSLLEVINFALNLYESMAQQAKKGFTRLVLENPKNGKRLTFDGDILL